MRHACVDTPCAVRALLRDSGLQGQSGLFLASALPPGCSDAARGLGPAAEPGDWGQFILRGPGRSSRRQAVCWGDTLCGRVTETPAA